MQINFLKFDLQQVLNALTIFFIITISYFISSFLRERVKVVLEKLFIKDIITKRKRTKPLLFYFDYTGYFLFLLFGIGYSNNKNIKYENYSLKRRIIFFISGIIVNIIIILFVLFLENSTFYFNKFNFVKDVYFYLIYINFILIMVNILPLPFSDILTILKLKLFYFPIYYILQLIIVFLLYYFKINYFLYSYFLKFITQFYS